MYFGCWKHCGAYKASCLKSDRCRRCSLVVPNLLLPAKRQGSIWNFYVSVVVMHASKLLNSGNTRTVFQQSSKKRFIRTTRKEIVIDSSASLSCRRNRQVMRVTPICMHLRIQARTLSKVFLVLRVCCPTPTPMCDCVGCHSAPNIIAVGSRLLLQWDRGQCQGKMLHIPGTA